MDDCHPQERLIATIATQLAQSKHVAVGASSPIPASAALLAQHTNPALRVSLLGSEQHSPFTDGGRELFDCAAQGRIDTFFLSGVQIDGAANVNLVGIGEYPNLKKRFAGSFGSAYLYDLVPRVILFCWSHTQSALVNKVDFISAAGPTGDTHFRPGGPASLVTNRCVFDYNRAKMEFSLASIHPGESADSVRENTAFGFSEPANVPATSTPTEQVLVTMRTDICQQMLEVYPLFAQKLWLSNAV
ncbi:MAG: hypothetical protein KTR32_43555 [Granulosicoccus sp.]|nr:hypothetical protein [Granulosicoccus sp.]